MSPRKVDCTQPELGALLHSYELGTLRKEETARFEEHLVGCDYCLTQLDATYTLEPFRDDVVTELRRTGDSFEAQLRRLKEKRKSSSWYKRLLRSAYTRYVFAPAAAVAILTFFIVRDKVPVADPPKEVITDLPSSRSTFKLTEPRMDSAVVPETNKEKSSGVQTRVTSEKAQKHIVSQEVPVQPLADNQADKSTTAESAETDDAVGTTEAGAEVIISQKETSSPITIQPQTTTVTESRLKSERFNAPAAAKSMGTFEMKATAASNTAILPAFRTTDADKIRVTIQRAKVLYESGSYRDALVYLEQARLETPASGDVDFYWGLCRFLPGEREPERQKSLSEADAAFARSEQNLQAGDTLQHWVTWYRASISFERGDMSSAYEGVRKLEKGSAPLRDMARELKSKLLKSTEPQK